MPKITRFDRVRKMLGFSIAPLFLVSFMFFDIPSLTSDGKKTLSILLFTITLWVTEAIPIPVTSLLVPCLLVLFGVSTAKSAFAPFANPLIFLFIGSFIIAEAMMESGLTKRIAISTMNNRVTGRNSIVSIISLILICSFLSMWISNTSSTAMFYPILLGVLKEIDERRIETKALLSLAYGASIGGIGTPVGTAPNIITLGFLRELGTSISFFQWMLISCPILLLSLTMLILITMKKEFRAGRRLTHKGIELPPLSRSEKNTIFAFGTAVTLWVLPGIISILYGSDSGIAKKMSDLLNEGVVALISASLLFILPVHAGELRFTMTWERAVRIDWGTILLFGGGLSLGEHVFKTGLADFIGKGLIGLTGVGSLFAITMMASLVAVLLTETTSNTASTSMVVPLFIAIAKSAGVSPIPPAIAAGIAASFAFVLPVSTPPNAIVYGSGKIPIIKMIKTGIILDIVCFLILNAFLISLCRAVGLI